MSTNDTPVDEWSMIHFMTGYLAARLGISPALAMGLAIVYEVVERVVESTEAGQRLFQTTGPEVPSNQATDLLVFGLGYWLGSK